MLSASARSRRGLHAPYIGLAQDQFDEGISREGLSFIFLNACHVDSPRRATERLSLDLLPVTGKPALLSLSDDAPHQLKADTETTCGCVTRPPRCPQRRNRSQAAKKASRKSAAFDAALAARTTARLSSRSTRARNRCSRVAHGRPMPSEAQTKAPAISATSSSRAYDLSRTNPSGRG